MKTIVVKLKDDAAEFAQKSKVEEVIKRYSSFVQFPINLNTFEQLIGRRSNRAVIIGSIRGSIRIRMPWSDSILKRVAKFWSLTSRVRRSSWMRTTGSAAGTDNEVAARQTIIDTMIV